MEKDELYTKVKYFLKEIIRNGYLEIEQIIEENQNNVTIIKGYLEVLDLVVVLSTELKSSLFFKIPLGLALLQCLNKLQTLLKCKIDLFLLLERKKAFFLFKYKRLRNRINKQRDEMKQYLESLQNEFYGYLINLKKEFKE